MKNKNVQKGHFISAVLTDVDGTLVTKDKALTPRTLQAVKELREHGIIFTRQRKRCSHWTIPTAEHLLL